MPVAYLIARRRPRPYSASVVSHDRSSWLWVERCLVDELHRRRPFRVRVRVWRNVCQCDSQFLRTTGAILVLCAVNTTVDWILPTAWEQYCRLGILTSYGIYQCRVHTERCSAYKLVDYIRPKAVKSLSNKSNQVPPLREDAPQANHNTEKSTQPLSWIDNRV